MQRLLIIQHEDDTPAGTTLEWAQARKLQVHIWQPAKEPQPPVSTPYLGIVICGGGMDTFEEEKHPWLITEKNFLREQLRQKTKIFGLCLGSQLLAEIFGGRVYQHSGWEIGFLPVKNSQGESLTVFHWHHCTFELPPQAERIFHGDYCLNQAFKVGDQVIATQFHPESTAEWVRTCSQELQAHHQGNVQSQEQILGSLSLLVPLQKWYFQQLDELFLAPRL